MLSKEELNKLSKRTGGMRFGLIVTGKIGEKAHTVEIHNPKTGEKQFLLKNNIKKEFKGFKTN